MNARRAASEVIDHITSEQWAIVVVADFFSAPITRVVFTTHCLRELRTAVVGTQYVRSTLPYAQMRFFVIDAQGRSIATLDFNAWAGSRAEAWEEAFSEAWESFFQA